METKTNKETLRKSFPFETFGDETCRQIFESLECQGITLESKSGMTLKEFDSTKFGAGTKIIFKGKEFDLISVELEEKLVGIDEFGTFDDDELPQLQWKRFENVIIKNS